MSKEGRKALPEHRKIYMGCVGISSEQNNNQKPPFFNETSNSINLIEFQSLALVKCLKSSARAQLAGTVSQLMMLEVVYLPSTFAVPFPLICSLHASTKEVVFKDKSLTLPAAGRSPRAEPGEDTQPVRPQVLEVSGH